MHKNESYYHLPGGGIEFLENSDDVLRREISEEIGCGIVDFSLLKTLTNMFEIDGMKAYEIVQINNVELDINPKILYGKAMTGDVVKNKMKQR